MTDILFSYDETLPPDLAFAQLMELAIGRLNLTDAAAIEAMRWMIARRGVWRITPPPLPSLAGLGLAGGIS